MPAVAELIPAHRFAKVLVKQRHASGVGLDELAARSDGQFTVADLSALENGTFALPEEAVPVVSRLYDIGCQEIVPHRAKLQLDLGARYLRVAGRETVLPALDQGTVLDRYLSLLYLVRGEMPGITIPLRADDLAILEASLHERAELLEEQLLAAMATEIPAIERLLARFRQRVWVPGAGVLVGAVSLGSLVFASSGDPDDAIGGGAAAASSLKIDLQLGRPNVVEVSSSVVESSTSTTASTTLGSTTTSTTSSTTSTSPVVPNVVVPNAVGFDEPVPTTAAPARHPDWAADLVMHNEGAGKVALEATSLINLDVRSVLPGWRVEIHGHRSGFRGLTYPDQKVIEIFVRTDDSAQMVASVLAHEFGHAYDVTYLNDDLRDRWLGVRGLGQWWVGGAVSDFAAGQGDFAEAFATVVARDPMHHLTSGPLDDNERAVLAEILNA